MTAMTIEFTSPKRTSSASMTSFEPQTRRLRRAIQFARSRDAWAIIGLWGIASVGWLFNDHNVRQGMIALTTFLSVFLMTSLRARLDSTKRLREASDALRAADLVAVLHEQRIKALSQIAAIDVIDDDGYARAVVGIAAQSIFPQERIVGWLGHVEAGRFVIDASSSTAAAGADESAFLALCDQRNGELVDLAVHLGGDRTAARFSDWKNTVAVPIHVGAAVYVLGFLAPEREPDSPFGDEAVAFIELVASSLNARFFQRDQLTRIRRQTQYDALTGLANRTSFRNAVRHATDVGESFAVVALDLDRFGEINKTHGHVIGDEVLVEIAARLQSIGERDLVARLSGDDFAILLPHVSNERDASERVRRYMQSFESPFHTGDREGRSFLAVSSSLGYALFPAQGTEVDELMRRADAALHVAKAGGCGLAIAFSPTIEQPAGVRHLRRAEIIAGFESDAFTVEYQPTFDIHSRGFIGAEALIRWDHPTRGRLSPGEFISFATQYGLMNMLSHWVFRRVVADLRSAALPSNFRCFVNVPAFLLYDAAFTLELEGLLEETPYLADHLGIEITESDAMRNIEGSIVALRRLRSLGLRIAIDDFGTGHSSMAYLKRLPIDVVKIDKSFVSGLPHDRGDVAVMEMSLGLARQFGFTTLAEGIETDEQMAWLNEHGCTAGQGYLVSAALTTRDFLSLISDLESQTPRAR